MSSTHLRSLAARTAEWDSRRRDWRRCNAPKHDRVQTRDRDMYRRHMAWVRRMGLILVVLGAAVVSYLGVTLDVATLGGMLLGLMLLFIDPCLVAIGFADLARAARRLAGQDLPAMARERRSASAPARAIAAIAAGACARFRLARQAAHRLAARLRAVVGTTAPTSHPRLAASLAADYAAPSAA